MLTLPVEAWIGNAAAVLSGAWGAVTRQSEQSGYSRTAIYTHATRVVQAVANEQAGGVVSSSYFLCASIREIITPTTSSS